MFRYILQRSLTYLVMVFITTTMGYFAAVTALKPALLEQEKVPKPSPEQVNRNFASLGLDPEMNPWDRYVQWLTNVVTKFDWGRSPNGAYINQEFGQRVWVSTRLLLVATILCRVTGWDVLDGLMGVGVAVFILISGWGLVMDTLSPLLGESPSEDLVEHIEQTVMSYPGVLGVHDLMVHDYGPGHQFASIHVELPAEQDPLEAHDLIDNIERDFMRNDHLMVTIHYDPIVTSDAAVGVLRSRLTEKLRQLDPELSLHDLRIVPGKTHTNVLFDLVLPAGYAGDKVELLTQMEQFIKEQDPAYNCIIKLEQSYTAAAHK